MHEHINNRVRSVRNRVVNRRESGGLWLWLRRERDGGKHHLRICAIFGVFDDSRIERMRQKMGTPRGVESVSLARPRTAASAAPRTLS